MVTAPAEPGATPTSLAPSGTEASQKAGPAAGPAFEDLCNSGRGARAAWAVLLYRAVTRPWLAPLLRLVMRSSVSTAHSMVRARVLPLWAAVLSVLSGSGLSARSARAAPRRPRPKA
jgi:hypothetical protein